jgi:hypothetical protein
MAGTASVKGFALRGLLRSVKDNGWSIPEVIGALPAEAKASFAKPVISSAWYPYRDFAALARTIESVHGSLADYALCRKLGHASAARDLGATFRIISAMASVEFLLKRGQVFWGQYCDRGRMVLESPDKLSFLARIEEFAEIDRAHCVLVEGWLEGLGEALGAVGMRCRQTRCVHRGDSRCEYHGQWTAQRGLLR